MGQCLLILIFFSHFLSPAMYSGTLSPNPTWDRYTLKRVSLIQVLVMKVLLATLVAPLASLFMAVAAQAELRT